MQLNSIIISTALGATIVQTTDPAVNATETVNDQTANTLSSSGTGAGNADGIYRNSTISVVSGTPLVIDLTALHDINGNAISVANVVGFKFRNTGSGGTLTLGGGSSPVMAAQLPVEAGGDVTWNALKNGGLSLPVAGGTKNLQIVASTGTITGTLTILTRSA